MWVAFPAFAFPLQELTKGRAPMAVARFFLGGKFSECLANLFEVEERIISKAVAAPRLVQDEPFGLAVKGGQSVSVARSRNYADKAGRAKFIWNIMQLAQQASVIGLVVRILYRAT